MNPAKANLITAVILIAMGLWGYISSESPSPTALIPVAFGALFAILYPWMKKENKIVSHIVVVLTLLILAALFKPLSGAMEADNTMAIVRISIMILICIFAMIIYVKSFMAARNKN